MADSHSKKKKGLGSKLKNIFKSKDKSKAKPGDVTPSAATSDPGSAREQTFVDQQTPPVGHAEPRPGPIEAADQKEKAAHSGGAAIAGGTPVVSPSPVPVSAVKDQGGREKLQKAKHEIGSTPINATAGGADAGSGKTVAIDQKTGFRDVAVPRQATKERKAAEAGLLEKGLETLDPGSTQVGEVVQEDARSSSRAQKEAPHGERALNAADTKARPSAPTTPSPVSKGRPEQGSGAATSPASPAKMGASPLLATTPVSSEAVKYKQQGHGKVEPGGNILERVVAKGDVPSSAFADAPMDKPSAGDSGIPAPRGEYKPATPSPGGVQIPTPIGDARSAESRAMELPGGNVIPTPVDARESSSRKPSTHDSIPIPVESVQRAGDILLPDRDPKRSPPLVSSGDATGAASTKSAVEKAAASVLGVGSVPGDKLPSGDEPAGQLQGDAPGQGAGVLETLKSYVPGLDGAKAGESAAPLGAKGTGQGRGDSHSGQEGDDAASHGGVLETVKSYVYGRMGAPKEETFPEGADATAGGGPAAVPVSSGPVSGAKGLAEERRVGEGGEVSRGGDFGPLPGHEVTYEAALAGEHHGGMLTIAGFSVDVGGVLRLAWEMSVEAVVLVAAFVVGTVPWLRGQQATIIDMDYLDDLWADWFGPGRTPSAVIGSQEDRT